ncbi:MAG: hypothetical protein K0S20_201 [Patescibacteria group bacterium]|jgi:hypothetical protein|nr:hypothetical protein [Patescibacteria group bacterium]
MITELDSPREETPREKEAREATEKLLSAAGFQTFFTRCAFPPHTNQANVVEAKTEIGTLALSTDSSSTMVCWEKTGRNLDYLFPPTDRLGLTSTVLTYSDEQTIDYLSRIRLCPPPTPSNPA